MKTVLEPVKIISAADMTTDFVSDPVEFQYMDNVAVQLNFVGDAVGSFSVLGSIDNVFFIPITLSSTPVAAGADGQVLINMQGLAFNSFKIAYTATSGSSVCDGFASIKAI